MNTPLSRPPLCRTPIHAGLRATALLIQLLFRLLLSPIAQRFFVRNWRLFGCAAIPNQRNRRSEYQYDANTQHQPQVAHQNAPNPAEQKIMPLPVLVPDRPASRQYVRCQSTGESCLPIRRPWPFHARQAGGAWSTPDGKPATYSRRY